MNQLSRVCFIYTRIYVNKLQLYDQLQVPTSLSWLLVALLCMLTEVESIHKDRTIQICQVPVAITY